MNLAIFTHLSKALSKRDRFHLGRRMSRVYMTVYAFIYLNGYYSV